MKSETMAPSPPFGTEVATVDVAISRQTAATGDVQSFRRMQEVIGNYAARSPTSPPACTVTKPPPLPMTRSKLPNSMKRRTWERPGIQNSHAVIGEQSDPEWETAGRSEELVTSIEWARCYQRSILFGFTLIALHDKCWSKEDHVGPHFLRLNVYVRRGAHKRRSKRRKSLYVRHL